MNYFLGLDVGSVNVKLCVVTEDGKVVKFDVEKIEESLRAAFAAHPARFDPAERGLGRRKRETVDADHAGFDA